MRICAISDLHGHLPKIEESDLLLIAGDICPTYDHDIRFQYQWLDGSFREWLKAQPAKDIVLVAGNHDFIFEKNPQGIKDLNLPCHYLENEAKEIAGLKIYGSPWSLWFWDWAFNSPTRENGGEEFLAKFYKDIPDDTDIIISHGPPFGYGDLTSRGESTGSTALLDRIKQIKAKYVIAGHIHEAYGKYEIPGIDTIVYNASILNLRYKNVNKPTYFEI